MPLFVATKNPWFFCVPEGCLDKFDHVDKGQIHLQFRGAVSTGGSPLDFLCFFSSIDVQFSKTSPLKSGESSEKSSGENRVKSCHVCGCHGFFGPEKGGTRVPGCSVFPQISPKSKFLGRISRGHPGVTRTDIPAQNFGQGAQKSWKNRHLGADIRDPKAQTSTTLRDFQKFRSENFGLNFSEKSARP